MDVVPEKESFWHAVDSFLLESVELLPQHQLQSQRLQQNRLQFLVSLANSLV